MLKIPSTNEPNPLIEQSDTAATSITKYISSLKHNLSSSASMELEFPTSKLSNKPGLIQNPPSWLQNNSKDYLTKAQAILDSVTNFTNPNDIIEKYEEFVSFVHSSVTEIKKYIGSRPDVTDIEGKLTKVECNQIRRDEQVNYLTSQCRGWWVMSDELQNEHPRTYENLWPWLGSEDNRNAGQYVEEFIHLVLPYCSDNRMAVEEFTDRLVIEPDDSELFRIDPKSTFQQCVGKFIKKFSTDEISYNEIVCFDNSVLIDSGYYDFALYWLSKFRFNPRADPYWVLDKLIEKLPDRYKSSLRNLKKNFDVSYASILKAIYKRAAKLQDSVPETCKYLGYHIIPNESGAPLNGSYATDEVNANMDLKPKSIPRKKLPRSLEEEVFIKQCRKADAIKQHNNNELIGDLIDFRIISFTEINRDMEWEC